MGKQVLEQLSRKDLEKELICNIKELDIQDYIRLNKYNAITYLTAYTLTNPIPPEIAEGYRDLFDKIYGERFKSKFTINSTAINRMIGENWYKKYLHIFFINDRNASNELSIVFRFSRIKDYTPNHFDIIDFEKESAYWLLDDGTVEPFDANSESFTDLMRKYKDGVGNEILAAKNSKLTYYITYEVANILSFNGFEQDVTFEVICVERGYDLKLGLQTYIIDNDRVHHIDDITGESVYKGYYDLGDLKP